MRRRKPLPSKESFIRLPRIHELVTRKKAKNKGKRKSIFTRVHLDRPNLEEEGTQKRAKFSFKKEEEIDTRQKEADGRQKTQLLVRNRFVIHPLAACRFNKQRNALIG